MRSKSQVFHFFPFSVGLDAAGKTTILYKLKLGEIVTTIPTIGKLIIMLNIIIPTMDKLIIMLNIAIMNIIPTSPLFDMIK